MNSVLVHRGFNANFVLWYSVVTACYVDNRDGFAPLFHSLLPLMLLLLLLLAG